MPTPLNIESTYETPKVVFNQNPCNITIDGVSIPVIAVNFYNDLIESIKEEISNNPKEMTFNCNLIYFNTGTARCLLTMFNLLMNYKEKNPQSKILINWYYEDDDIMECGKDYQYMTSLDFNFIEIKNPE